MSAAPRQPVLGLLRLLRVGTLFSPAADVLAGGAVVGLPPDAIAARAAAASVCLYAAGMVWNDLADRRVDAVQRPERPLVRGDVGVPVATALGVALLLAGVLLSPCRVHHAAIAALVLCYDFGSKRAPLLGVLLMGTLRGLNLAVGLSLAPTAAPAAREALVVAASCYGVYIAAVTILGIFEDVPNVRGRAVAALQTAPPLAALFALAIVQQGFWPAPALVALPAAWFLRRNTRRRDWPQAEIRRSMGYLLLGTMLFTGALALAAGAPWLAAGIVAAIVPARRIARSIALT